MSVWYFPSFFSERSNVDESSASLLAWGQRIVSVANLDKVREKINITSSQSPTLDQQLKPDVAAPGTDIVAANGFGRLFAVMDRDDLHEYGRSFCRRIFRINARGREKINGSSDRSDHSPGFASAAGSKFQVGK